MTITHDHPAPVAATAADGPLRSIWAEITGMCQLSCLHCYAGSGPAGTHGIMTPEAWETALTDAAALGARIVCFIGGEPTLHPALPRLVHHALSLGMDAEIFSNLAHVTPELWELFGTPGVRIATSWYTSDRDQHKQITGRDTHRQTLTNIAEAARRKIPLRAGVIDGIIPGQRTQEGTEMLRAHGVTDIGGDHLREFGRGTKPDPTQACGACGNHRAAILPDGTVTPCPLTRWMHAGNVQQTPLADIVATVTQMAATLPNNQTTGDCAPDCLPATNVCGPDGNCRPTRPAPQSGTAAGSGGRDCMPDHYCDPNCNPGVCKPRI